MQIKALIPKRLKNFLKRIYYFGSRYTCPFCRSRLRTFLPFGFPFPVLKEKKVAGAGLRPQARCPICFSLDRERLVYLYLQNRTDFFKKHLKVLHVAPESRLAEIFLRRQDLDYLRADLHPQQGMVEMDLTDIRYPDNAFDVVVCCHVLEHIIDDGKAMRELFRVLKPEGWAVLQVPISLSLKNTFEDPSITTEAGREEAFGQADHVRIYACEDYRNRLEKAGFEVDLFRWEEGASHFGYPGNKYGLNLNETVFRARKPARRVS